MKNKKAQTGKIIASLGVIVPVILIMTLFVSASLAISSFKKENQRVESPKNQIDSLLLKKITLDIEEQKEFLILDAYVLLDKKKIEKEQFQEALKTLVDEKNPCLALAKGNSPSPAGLAGAEANDDFVIELKEDDLYLGNIGTTPLSLIKYKKLLSQTQVKTTEDIFIESYIGECPNE
ncbi:hypothetical protein HY450_03895 [Candidatus Pacearchaeota archaeon]|nr:hypothetical protein [Candidatus Pacearchaeota archaeon]